MYYSELVRKAYAILWDAHRDDVDKGGYPYVFHPFYLATQMEDENSTCTALLHDVIEDHGDRYSLESLAQAGFADGVPYRDYVRALADDPIARKVKLADLRHNTDTRRVGGRRTPKHDLYLEAIRYLEELN